MSKFEYDFRVKHTLKLSQKQLEHISGLHIITMFLENLSLDKLPQINSKWIRAWTQKEFTVWDIKELKEKGIVDMGRFTIRKTKKGYVVEERFNWRSKELITTKYGCKKCKKPVKLNWQHFCKVCTNELGGAKGIQKYLRNKGLYK